jgi:hypothetical protein
VRQITSHLNQSWFYAANDVLVQSEYPHRSKLRRKSFESPRFKNVLHLVRCPMHQISAFTAHTNASYEFARLIILEQIRNPWNVDSLDKGPCNQAAASNQNSTTGDHNLPERSLWSMRNHTAFFSSRKTLITNSGKGCLRGSRCWLHFAALAWLFWNSHIQRFVTATLQISLISAFNDITSSLS